MTERGRFLKGGVWSHLWPSGSAQDRVSITSDGTLVETTDAAFASCLESASQVRRTVPKISTPVNAKLSNLDFHPNS